jgi:hypothetical protein
MKNVKHTVHETMRVKFEEIYIGAVFTAWMTWGSIPGRRKIFQILRKRPDRFWDPANFLFNGYRVVSFALKCPRREVDLSPPSNARVKNMWCYVSVQPVRFNSVEMGYFSLLYSWFRHCVTSRKVAVSIPDGVTGIFQ